jgi:HEPN domain-containing protein
MRRREQALLLLRKAGQDEALLDAVLDSAGISDEIFGFHCQQAAEKMLKALLSDLGICFRKTHELGALTALIESSGCRLPAELADLDVLTPFGAVYRYEDFESDLELDRRRARQSLRSLKEYVEEKLREREPQG